MASCNYKIAISGANGFVARNLRKLLSQKNIDTVCLSRRNFRARKNETKITSLDYSEIPISEIKDCTAFVHLAGSGMQKPGSEYSLTNISLTKKLLTLCKKSGIDRFIFMSGLGVSYNSVTDYFISKYTAEQAVVNSGLDHTIFRPSYILGKDDHLTKSLKKQIAARRLVLPGSGKFLMQPVCISDACQILYQSVISDRYLNRTVDLVGPETITYKHLLSKLRFKITKLSLEESYRDAIYQTGPFGIDDLNILVGGFVGDFEKLQRLSGLEFSRYTDALKSSGLS